MGTGLSIIEIFPFRKWTSCVSLYLVYILMIQIRSFILWTKNVSTMRPVIDFGIMFQQTSQWVSSFKFRSLNLHFYSIYFTIWNFHIQLVGREFVVLLKNDFILISKRLLDGHSILRQEQLISTDSAQTDRDCTPTAVSYPHP